MPDTFKPMHVLVSLFSPNARGPLPSVLLLFFSPLGQASSDDGSTDPLALCGGILHDLSKLA